MGKFPLLFICHQMAWRSVYRKEFMARHHHSALRKLIRMIVAATKAFLAREQVIPVGDAREFAAEKSVATYFECSAKTGEGITEILTRAAELTTKSRIAKHAFHFKYLAKPAE
jgi:hypothetical protein